MDYEALISIEYGQQWLLNDDKNMTEKVSITGPFSTVKSYKAIVLLHFLLVGKQQFLS